MAHGVTCQLPVKTPKTESKYLVSRVKSRSLASCVFLDQLSDDSCGASGGLRGHPGAHADGCLCECATRFVLSLQESPHISVEFICAFRQNPS